MIPNNRSFLHVGLMLAAVVVAAGPGLAQVQVTSVSASPSSGPGPTVFTLVASYPGNYQSIDSVYLLLNWSLDGTDACYVQYSLSGNAIYLRNDGSTAWLGGIAPQTAQSVSNSQCSINAGASTVTGSGSTLTVSLSVSFNSTFPGQQSVYAEAVDLFKEDTGLQQMPLTYTAYTASAQLPSGSVTPASVADQSANLTFHATDVNGYRYIAQESMLFASNSGSTANSCYLIYYRDWNILYLAADDGVTWLSDSPVTPGTSSFASNSQCTVTAVNPPVGSGNNLDLGLSIQFSRRFTGARNVYQALGDRGGQTTTWQPVGTWNVSVAVPVFSPSAGVYTSSQSVTISTTTSGATIRYTTDNTIPSGTNGTIYTSPVTIPSSETLQAIAYQTGWMDSPVVSGSYAITTTPTITSLSPATGPAGTSVTITGGNFGLSQGMSTVTFNGVVAAPTVWSQTSITAPVPIGASTGNVIVTVGGVASNGVLFTVTPPPSISSLNPLSGAAGHTVTISGTGFGSTQGSSRVTFNGASAGSALQWSDTVIIAIIPSTATTGNVVVTVNGVNSNGAPFTAVTSPSIGLLSPASGQVGATVKITGGNFGASQGSSTVTFNGVLATPTSWSSNTINVPVPTGATTGSVVVTVGGSPSSGAFFAIPPILMSASPTPGTAGMPVTLSGSGFGPTQGAGAVWLGTTYGTIVSWSDTQIVAIIASNSKSGTARVQQAGAWSGTVAFAVNTPTISSVTPTSGVPGTQVTITGTSFGAQQGSGQVWLGTANGTVQSWSDTQVVAVVAAGSASGNAQILQNGVQSNAVPFNVNTPQITGISPTSGGATTSVTIAGSGFGLTQGAGTVLLGSINGQVSSWSDSQIVATVAAGSLSGIVRVTQNGIQSNSKSFGVPGAGGSVSMMAPNTLRMVVGDTHTIQALNSSNQPITGLTWTSSDSTIVSLSTDDPPVLTAVAAGHVTITAGSASADVTVSSVAFAPGTVLWSNPVGGASVDWMLPAVPSSTGVADVFAFSGKTVYAITSDGATAWSADVSDFECPEQFPDFQGGLVVAEGCNGSSPSKVVKLDGLTGHRYPAYTPSCRVYDFAVHPDGTVFAIQDPCGSSLLQTVIGVDPTNGTVKFQVPAPQPSGGSAVFMNNLIIAGDGFAYVTYDGGWWGQPTIPNPYYQYDQYGLLRVSSSGASNYFTLKEWYTTINYDSGCACYPLHPIVGLPRMITNADAGVLAAWYEWSALGWTLTLANATGGGVVSVVSAPQVAPYSPDAFSPSMQLNLQAQDGSFIGWTSDGGAYSFDVSGNLHWTVPNVSPAIATADGGFISNDTICSSQGCTFQAYTFDQNGNATGQMASLPIRSWTGNLYQSQGGLSVDAMVLPSIPLADASFWATLGGNPSGTGSAYVQCPCLLQSTDTTPSGQLLSALRSGQAALTPRDQQGQTYVLTVSQPGIQWNAGQSFVLAAKTASAALTQSGAKSNSTPILLSTITDFATALTANGPITGGVMPTTALGMNGPIVGGVTYFGHGGWLVESGSGIWNSALFFSPTKGIDYNLSKYNIATLSNANLGPNAAIVLNACHAGENKNGAAPIAQLLANQLKRTVWAYPVGMYYSANPAPRILKPIGFNSNGKPIYETVNTVPLYMVPNANGVKAIPFYPH